MSRGIRSMPQSVWQQVISNQHAGSSASIGCGYRSVKQVYWGYGRCRYSSRIMNYILYYLIHMVPFYSDTRWFGEYCLRLPSMVLTVRMYAADLALTGVFVATANAHLKHVQRSSARAWSRSHCLSEFTKAHCGGKNGGFKAWTNRSRPSRRSMVYGWLESVANAWIVTKLLITWIRVNLLTVLSRQR